MTTRGTTRRFSDEVVAALARVADLELTEESQRIVASILEKQVEQLRSVGLYDLIEAEPESTYDPRWES
jgi:hypothetical protein